MAKGNDELRRKLVEAMEIVHSYSSRLSTNKEIAGLRTVTFTGQELEELLENLTLFVHFFAEEREHALRVCKTLSSIADFVIKYHLSSLPSEIAPRWKGTIDNLKIWEHVIRKELSDEELYTTKVVDSRTITNEEIN